MSRTAHGTRELATLIAARARPSGQRPRLAEDQERRLDDIERRSAICYAEMEHASYRYEKLAKEIGAGASPIPIHVEKEDSLVINLDEAREKADSSHDE